MSAIPDKTPPFTEDTVSQLPALHLLQKLGWTLLTPAEALKLRRGKKGEVILRPVLEEQLGGPQSVRVPRPEVPVRPFGDRRRH